MMVQILESHAANGERKATISKMWRWSVAIFIADLHLHVWRFFEIGERKATISKMWRWSVAISKNLHTWRWRSAIKML
jgi:hypothetical protein